MSPRFATRLLHWFEQHGRHDLPWQHPRTPYRVWVSEIMLQQTQVVTVIGYFDRFVTKFPDLHALAAAPQDEVLALWAGLGYYSRARNLHRSAQICAIEHGGALPVDMETLCSLPGIGRSTAAAILSQAHAVPVAILDGNVKRVLSRHAGIEGYPGLPAIERKLLREAEARLPDESESARMPDYTQALMDLGAGLCTRSRPKCHACPVGGDCVAFRDSRVADLPTRKAARAVPEKSIEVLIVTDQQGRVLLQRRPPFGIWGGLWSLPEFGPMQALADASPAITINAAPRQMLRAMPVVHHRFTHFLLHIYPYSADATSVPVQACEKTEQRWVAMADMDRYGTPAPIRRLLQNAATVLQLSHR